MFAIYHEDTVYDKTVLIKVCQTEDEAREYLDLNYKHRRIEEHVKGDYVYIAKEPSGPVVRWKVKYMPQFEALKSWKFRSSSGSGVYETRLTKTGILSCDCRGWTFKKAGKPRSCKHTDEVIRDENLTVSAVGQYWMVDDKKLSAAKQKYGNLPKTTPQQKFLQLVAEYESAVTRMAALDPKDMFDMLEEVELAKFKVESYMVLLDQKGIDGMVQYEAAQAKLGAALMQ
jgi:hypothetical protein